MQSAKWREDGVPRNCRVVTQCSYVDVLSVRHGNAAGICAQGATETDNESEFWQWWASVVEWTFQRHDESQCSTVHGMVVGKLGGAEPAQ